jgi:homocitrate synthase
MCPHDNGDALSHDPSEMVAVQTNGSNGRAATNGKSNGRVTDQQRFNPYAPRASDFLSNVSNFNIIESTLRGKGVFTPQTHGDGLC